jgi:hypothetical protein
VTAGIAIASWKDEALVLVAADSRVSRDKHVLNDASIKTLEIAKRTGIVFSGPTTPAFVGADMVRTLVRLHRPQPGALSQGFFDVARLLGHFQSQAARNAGAIGETIVAGFYRSGAPGLAQIVITEDRSRIAYFSCPRGGTIALAVGAPEAKRLLLRGLEAAKHEGRRLTMTVVLVLEYMARHKGETFGSVGGQISIGGCSSDAEEFSWPAIEVDGRRYWRGADVTASWNSTWSPPIPIDYDEEWCARLDQEAPSLPCPMSGDKPRGTAVTLDIKSIPSEEVFRIHHDPPEF